MTAVARMAVLNLRTVAPYRTQGLVLLALCALISMKSPLVLLPALALFIIPAIVVHPFLVADKAGLENLYAVLPLRRRSVLYGHYAWALAIYFAAAAVGTALDFVLAHAKGEPFSGTDFRTMLTLSWALFAINIALQLPMLIRFGYTRVNAATTTLPITLITAAVVKLRLFPTITSVQSWLPLLGLAGVIALVASAAVAVAADQQRLH